MKYKDFEGPVEELVLVKIKEIEEKENVKILHAVESGSRAWGFASPDSDYDVRFIYVRDRDSYLSLQGMKDFLDWELNDVLDINGWDLKRRCSIFINRMQHCLNGRIPRSCIGRQMSGKNCMKALPDSIFQRNQRCIIIAERQIKIIRNIYRQIW